MNNWLFEGLEPGAYQFIMADPAWDFRHYSTKGRKKSAHHHYSCMSLDDIKALPVAALAAPDAICMLWVTNPMLPVGFEVLEAWGFTFKTAGHWVKRTKHGKLGFGTGYILRNAGEPFLIGTRGKPKTVRSVRGVFEGVVRAHSQKPEEAFRWAEELMPGARRVELFSRRTRPNWDVWGDEVGKLDEVAA